VLHAVRLCGRTGAMEPPMWGGLPRGRSCSDLASILGVDDGSGRDEDVRRDAPARGRREARDDNELTASSLPLPSSPIASVLEQSVSERAPARRRERAHRWPSPGLYDERVVGARPVDAESNEVSRRLSAGAREANEARPPICRRTDCSGRATDVRTSTRRSAHDCPRTSAFVRALAAALVRASATPRVAADRERSRRCPQRERRRRRSATRDT
jgi:hypothetical protein